MTVIPTTEVPYVILGVLTLVRTTLQLARATSLTLLSAKTGGSTLTRESMGAPCGRLRDGRVGAGRRGQGRRTDVDAGGWGVPFRRRSWGTSGVTGGRRTSRRMKSTRWMPRRLRPKKDVARRRNAAGSCGQAKIRGYPNGATRPG